MLLTENIWELCLRSLRVKLSEQQYEFWVKTLQPPRISELAGVFTFQFSFPSRFKLDWFRNQIAPVLNEVITTVVQQPVTIQVELVQGSASLHTSTIQKHQRIAIEEPKPDTNSTATSRLNHTQTFDNLVRGKSNEIAAAAAEQVALNPGKNFNPLFIYGGVGLGKTHLLQAIGNASLENGHSKVQYINAERFVSDVVKAFQRKNFDAFKHHYHSLDVLLIDDVQFFAGKEKTQEEFFYAFEALLSNHAQIILTSDTYPKALREIDQRLLSRFDSGLTVAIEPPEVEMRVAILKQKATQLGQSIPDEIAFYIAKNVRSNVRELEGSLRKVLATASFTKKSLTIELARNCLRDFISATHHSVSVDNIQKTVAEFFHISLEALLSRQRPNHIAGPRQIAMYLSKELTQKSLPEIGQLFAGRDHTTVLHAHRKISAARNANAEFNQQIHVIEQKLKA